MAETFDCGAISMNLEYETSHYRTEEKYLGTDQDGDDDDDDDGGGGCSTCSTIPSCGGRKFEGDDT